MKKTYETEDMILALLKFPNPATIRVTVDTKYVRLFLGQRDWQWDRDTGELVGAGTLLTDSSKQQKPTGGAQ